MKEYKVIKYSVRDPFDRGSFPCDMERSLNAHAEDGWEVLSIAGVDYSFIAILERDTTAEERGPYRVVDAHTHQDVADKDMKTVVIYSKLHHPNAKEAAEAECKRLNDEWQTKVCRSEEGKEEA